MKNRTRDKNCLFTQNRMDFIYNDIKYFVNDKHLFSIRCECNKDILTYEQYKFIFDSFINNEAFLNAIKKYNNHDKNLVKRTFKVNGQKKSVLFVIKYKKHDN